MSEENKNEEEIKELKASLSELTSKVKKYETDLAYLQNENQTLKEDKTKLMKDRADKGDDKDKTDYEAHINEKLTKEYGDKMTAIEKRAADAESKIRRYEILEPARKMAAEMGVLPKAMSFVEREIESNFDIFEGQILAKGEDGKPRKSKENPNNHFTLQEFFKGFATEHDYMIGNKTAAGTRDDANKSNGTSGAGAKPNNWEQLSSDDKRSWYSANPQVRDAEIAGG